MVEPLLFLTLVLFQCSLRRQVATKLSMYHRAANLTTCLPARLCSGVDSPVLHPTPSKHIPCGSFAHLGPLPEAYQFPSTLQSLRSDCQAWKGILQPRCRILPRGIIHYCTATSNKLTYHHSRIRYELQLTPSSVSTDRQTTCPT